MMIHFLLFADSKPEDLYLSPSQNKIIISEFGSLAPNTKYGKISFYDLVSESKGSNFFYEENTWETQTVN